MDINIIQDKFIIFKFDITNCRALDEFKYLYFANI